MNIYIYIERIDVIGELNSCKNTICTWTHNYFYYYNNLIK